MNKPKLFKAAQALSQLVDSDEFIEGYVHKNLYLSKADLSEIADFLLNQSEEAEDIS